MLKRSGTLQALVNPRVLDNKLADLSRYGKMNAFRIYEREITDSLSEDEPFMIGMYQGFSSNAVLNAVSLGNIKNRVATLNYQEASNFGQTTGEIMTALKTFKTRADLDGYLDLIMT